MLGFLFYGLTAPLYYSARALRRLTRAASRRRRYRRTGRVPARWLLVVAGVTGLFFGSFALIAIGFETTAVLTGRPDAWPTLGIWVGIAVVSFTPAVWWACKPSYDQLGPPPEDRPQSYYSNRR